MNSQFKEFRISDFKGKLLVLDFWATNCGSCIAAMPRLDSLQREFGDKLQIITVTDETPALVKNFLARHSEMRLPVIAADVSLKDFFPHRVLSHEVWIGSDGRLLATTFAEYVDSRNIRAYLRDGKLNLPVKEDAVNYDFKRPLMTGTGALFYSMVSGYRPGVSTKFGMDADSVHGKVRAWVVNFPLVALYMLALDHLVYFPKTFMDIRLTDSTLAKVPAGMYRDEWKQRHYWCYETVLPGTENTANVKEAMRQDLNRFFHVDGRMEKRSARSLSLERLDKSDAVLTKGGVPENSLHTAGVKSLVNASLSNLVWELNDLPGGLPAVDNTGIKGNVDLTLDIPSFRDTGALNAALKPYGLAVRAKVQELDLFILTDAINPKQ